MNTTSVNMTTQLKVLSLFDGISVAQQSLKELGIPCEYYASEIDKYAIQITQKNFPNTIQLGDVKEIDCTGGKLHYGMGRLAETDIDLMVGGSPCQDLSIAKKNREGLKGSRSGLFWEYVRILKEVQPKYFILENVASMPKEAKDTITEALGVEPIMINASLVSAQNRKRLFWVGKKVDTRMIGNWNSSGYEKVNISQPEDRGILLRDILENRDCDRLKSYCIDANYFREGKIGGTHQSSTRNYTIRVGKLNKGGQGDRIYSIEGKSVNLSANGGGRGAKTGLYLIQGGARRTRNGEKQTELNNQEKANAMTSVQTDSMVAIKDFVKKLTPIECERLQSFPDNFTGGVSNTQRYKALGNAFNCEVIKHIISFIY